MFVRSIASSNRRGEVEEMLGQDESNSEAWSWESVGEEPVYNIEVEGDHCYRIGALGMLVHNSSIPTIGEVNAKAYRISEKLTKGQKI